MNPSPVHDTPVTSSAGRPDDGDPERAAPVPFPYGPRGLDELRALVHDAVAEHDPNALFLNFAAWDTRGDETTLTFGFRRETPAGPREVAVAATLDPGDRFADVVDGLRQTIAAEFSTTPPSETAATTAAGDFSPGDVVVSVKRTARMRFTHEPTGVVFDLDCQSDGDTRCRELGMRTLRTKVLDYHTLLARQRRKE